MISDRSNTLKDYGYSADIFVNKCIRDISFNI